MPIADDILAHYGIELDDGVLEVGGELSQFGVKGMRWGVRKNDSGGSSSGGSGWTEDQKHKMKVVGGVALAATIAVGAVFAAKALSGSGGSAAATVSAGKKMAEETLRKKGAKKLIMNPETKKFLADGPERILRDQKEWSKFLGKSLDTIQKEDARFMAEQISMMTKAIGA